MGFFPQFGATFKGDIGDFPQVGATCKEDIWG